jgi:hypothetical protein
MLVNLELASEYKNMEHDEYIGKTVLIGMTYRDHEENFIEQKQLYGRIDRINQTEGMVIDLETGEEFKLPPDPNKLQPAAKGEYFLKTTGETVIDPDFTTIWTLTKAPRE